MPTDQQVGLRGAVSPGRSSGLFDFLRRVGAKLQWMAERQRQRRALTLLDQRLLDDIGLTREEVEHEIRRSIWK